MTDPARVLLADPPWKFGDKLPGPGRGAVKHYPCMSLQEIMAYPLPPLADDCLLLLWRVSAMQAEGLMTMRAWGFKLKSELVWLKQTSSGKRHFGMGRIVRGEHEVCLIGTRGRPDIRDHCIRDHCIRSTFTAPVGRHSEKPVAIYAIAERLCAGPYVEIFARQERPGWTCLGNEIAEAAQ